MNNWLEMGGYGLYVWGSMSVVLACAVIELISLRLRMKAITGKRQTNHP